MSQFDTEIYKQMVGLSPRSDAKPPTEILIPNVPSATPASDGLESNGQTKREWPLPSYLASEDDFMRDQAVAQAPEGIRRPDLPVLTLTPEQQKTLDSQANSAGDITTEPDQSPTASKRDFQLKDKLHEIREAGKELNKGNDLLSRLRRAKARVGDSVRKIAHLVTHAGETITGPIDALKDVVTVMVRNPEMRKEIVQTVAHDSKEVAIIIAEPIVEEVNALKKDYVDELVALRNTSIKINGTEYIIVDEVIDTAVAAKDGVVQTARNAHELYKGVARTIKYRIQSAQDTVEFHTNQAIAEIGSRTSDQLAATGQFIDTAGGRIRKSLIEKANFLRNFGVGRREAAEAVALRAAQRNKQIQEIRALAQTQVEAANPNLEAPQVKAIAPQTEAVRTPEGPVTSSADLRFGLLSDFEQDVIREREKGEMPTQPAPLPTDRYPII